MSVCIFKEQEKAEKVSKRESTLKEVESSTKDLRELLEQHAITGAILELSDDATVCEKIYRKLSSCARLTWPLCFCLSIAPCWVQTV